MKILTDKRQHLQNIQPNISDIKKDNFVVVISSDKLKEHHPKVFQLLKNVFLRSLYESNALLYNGVNKIDGMDKEKNYVYVQKKKKLR